MREMLYRSLARAILICALGVSGLVGYAQPGATVSVQSEDFNACALPTGWTTTINAGSWDWHFGLNFIAILNGDMNGTCTAGFDDDAAGSTSPPNDADLISPAVDVTSYAAVTLEFDYNTYLIGIGMLEVSVWDGSGWVVVFNEATNNPGIWLGQVPATVDVTAYKNANFQVKYKYADNGGWGYGVGVDNHSISGLVPYQYDAKIDFGNGYTQIPYSQTPYPISATAENVGTDPLTNVEVTIELTDGVTILSQTSAPQNLSAGQTFIFDYPGGFTPPNQSIWTATAEVTSAEIDDDPSNNVTSGVDYVFSDSVFSRDDFISIIALGYNGGLGSVGVGYDIVNRTLVAGIEIHLGGGGFAPNAGAEGKVLLYDFNDSLGVPGSVIAESDVFTTPSGPTTGLPLTVNFPKSIVIEPGHYVAVAEQTTTTFNGLGNAANIYTGFEDRMWVNFAGNASAIANDWGPVGAFFQVTPMVRIVESTACLFVNAGEDTTVCIDEPVLLGAVDSTGAPDSTAQLGTPPYSYSWTPTAGLDDPTSANPTWIATSNVDTPHATQFVVTVTDAVGCEVSDTVEITVNPKDTVALFLPTTDYCITDPADTIDYQPFGGILSGPGVILVDSGTVGPGAGGGGSANCVPGGPLTTTFSGATTGAPAPNGQMFDVNALTDIEINDFDIHMNGTDNIEIWTKSGTHVGFEANPAAWTLVTTVPNVTGNGLGVATPLNANVSIPIAAGATQALFITPNTSVSLYYSSGGTVGQIWASNSDLEVLMGSTVQNVGGPGGVQFSPRNWNGTIYYDICTGGSAGGGGSSSAGCLNSPPAVCQPSYGTGCAVGDQINNFSTTGGITNITNLNSGCNGTPSTAADFTNMMVTVPNGGGDFDFTVQAGAAFSQGFAIYVDYDQDGQFSSTEQVWNSGSASTAPFTGTVTVPASVQGGEYIMRVICTYLSVPTAACGSVGSTFGEAEDYTLAVECVGGGGGLGGAQYVFDPDSAGPGTHQLTYCLTNQYGCTSCDTFDVTVHPLPDATIDPVVAQCLNGDNIFLSAATPLGSWSGSGIVDPVAGEFDPSVAGIGNHTIYYEVLDPNGCFNIDSTVVRVNDIPLADAGADSTICAGEGLVIGGNPTGTPGTDPNGFIDNYSWSPQTGLSSSVDPNPTATPTTTTNYVVTVQDNNGCVDRDTVTITVLDAPIADAGDAVVNSCNGTPVVIGGNPSATGGTVPYTYSWEPAAGLSSTSSPNPSASPALNTVYTLTVTDANGCSDEATVEVRVVNGPVANAGVDMQVCSDVDATLGGIPTAAGGNPPYSYSWSPSTGLSDPNVANPVFNATNFTALPVPYSFTVTVTDQYGCESSDVVEVTLMPAVIVDAGADREICWGKSTQLGGVATATNGVPPYSYTWGPTVGLITPHVSNPVVTPTSSTIYTVQVEDDNGCIGEDDVTVIVNPLPLAEAGSDRTICKGTTVQIGGQPTANGGLAPYTYSWSPYIGLSDDNVANPLAGPSVTETFTLTVTDAKGCQDIDVVTVFVVENPVAAAGKDKEICLGNSIELGAKPAASNGQPPYNFKWTPNIYLDNDLHENPVATPTSAGSTTYYLTVWDANNCKDVDSMVLTVNPLPEPTITNLAQPLDFCINDQIITLNGDPSGGIYSGPGVSGSTFNPGNAGIGQHEITYTYTDSNGCTGTVSYVVNVHGLPIIYAGPDKTVYLGHSTTLDAVSGGNYTYIWDPVIYLDDPTALNPNVIEPEQTTTYTITATDAFGCERSDEVTVFVDFNTPLDIANTFSPNGDGINDTWVIPDLDFFTNNRVEVYNRWGQLVFERDNYSNADAWDGDDLPEGTYFYVITLDLQGARTHRGTVTIVR